MIQRILVVGYGSIGARHVRVAREVVPGAHVTVLRHLRCDDVLAAGIDQCVTSIDDALACSPDVAVIANPASHHVAVALRLASAGVHLLVEKPISSHAADVPALIDASHRSGVVLMTGYNLRFLDSLVKFRDLIRSGMVGRVLSVRAEAGQYLPGWRPSSDYRTGVSAQRSLGGGVLLELSHEIDYLRWIFGEVASVSATLGRLSALEIDVEDTAHLVMIVETAAGVRGPTVRLDIDFIRHDATRTCTAIGEIGTLAWNANDGTVELYEQGGTGWRPVFSSQQQRDDSYRIEWRRFLNCVDTGAPAPISGEDGLAVLRIVEAARQSSFSRAVVDLPATPASATDGPQP